MNKDDLIKQCRYYKGEEKCPYGGTEADYWEYRTLLSNPKSFWWWAEKEVVRMGWDDVKMGVRCKIYKHMEYAPMSEEMCLNSYLNNTENGLLNLCRYYKGEKENPFSLSPYAWFWDMERVYVNNEGKFTGECEIYEAHHFRDFDMPYCLLMVMFTSWAKTTHDLEKEIPEFYKLIEQYLNNRKD